MHRIPVEMRLIGLTGGIASGKSAVARMLRASGVPVIDADQLARDVVTPGSDGLRAIVERFGLDVLDATGALDRKKLGAIVFADADARAAVNAITHPRVAQLALEKLDALRAENAPVAVYEVPLLFENGLESMMDATLLVAAPVDVQVVRLRTRDGLDEDAANARIAAQMSLALKRAKATAIVENTGTLAELAAALRVAWKQLTGDDVAFAP